MHHLVDPLEIIKFIENRFNNIAMVGNSLDIDEKTKIWEIKVLIEGIFIHTVYRMYSSILYTGYIHPYCIQDIFIHTIYRVYSSILYTGYIHPYCIQSPRFKSFG